MTPSTLMAPWTSQLTGPYNSGYLPLSVPSAPIATPSPMFPGNLEGSDWSQGQAFTANTNPTGFLSSLSSWLGDFGKGAIGTKDAPGWGGMAVGAVNGLASAYMGMQQYGMAKQQFEESKRQFGLNYEAQKNLTNSRLEDRQRARVASNPGAYVSVGDYMNRYGVR